MCLKSGNYDTESTNSSELNKVYLSIIKQFQNYETQTKIRRFLVELARTERFVQNKIYRNIKLSMC